MATKAALAKYLDEHIGRRFELRQTTTPTMPDGRDRGMWEPGPRMLVKRGGRWGFKFSKDDLNASFIDFKQKYTKVEELTDKGFTIVHYWPHATQINMYRLVD